jgi:hypothetical protein
LRSARYTLSAASASPLGRTRCTTPSFCSKFCYQGRRPAGDLWPT